MPIYDYQCTKCGHLFDELQKFEDPPPPCPNKEEGNTCGGETERKLSKGGTFHLKGTGWYVTDYK